MSRIEGISHMTFIVQDIEKSARMLNFLFEATVVYDSQDKNYSISREKFFLINDLWVVFMEGNSLTEITYNHIAFKIDAKDYDDDLEKIKKLGLEIKKDRSRIKAESSSIYFYDYDNHLFELHTGTLAERLKGYTKN